MQTTLSAAFVDQKISELERSDAPLMSGAAGTGGRQPVHTVYGGAQLFKADTIKKLGLIARRSMSTFAKDPDTFAQVFDIPASISEQVFRRVGEKLDREPIEDFRIDFEDGYGVRSESDEDAHAIAAASETAAAMSTDNLPPFFGVRIKSLSPETRSRAIRTLDIYLSELLTCTDGKLPTNFVITLPKIQRPDEVATIAHILDEIERGLNIGSGAIKIEIMVETARSIIAADGMFALPRLVEAGGGRVSAAHFGAFDYTADCGITSSQQDLRHAACDFARNVMQVSLAGTGINLSDGATTVMPVPPNRGDELTTEQAIENGRVVHDAWRIHYSNCMHALECGFYQGWDLHPAQLPARYAAVYTFFLTSLADASERLKNFLEKGARANLVGNNFDDAATGQGLLNFFVRAINCGAISEQDTIERAGISLDELRSGSFARILELRK